MDLIQSVVLVFFSFSILFAFINLLYIIATAMEIPQSTYVKSKKTESYEYVTRQRKNRHTPQPSNTYSAFTTKKVRQTVTHPRSYKKYVKQGSNSNKIKNRY